MESDSAGRLSIKGLHLNRRIGTRSVGPLLLLAVLAVTVLLVIAKGCSH